LLQVHEQHAGKQVRCGGCRNVVDAPGVAAALTGSLSPGRPDARPTPPPVRAPARGPGTNGSPHPGPAVARELYDFLPPPQAAGELGRLGPYRVLKVLGSGGMGVVYQAEDPQLRRAVALKALLPALAVNPVARQRFLHEARAAALVAHDHVVTIYEVGEDRGIPYLAMQLLRGETLEARLRRQRRLSIPEVMRIGREIAAGLAMAHAKGLIHRDVKPSNIWLEDRSHKRPACELEPEPASGTLAVTGGRVKLLDFGLARAASGDAHLTQSGALIGTPGYLAPEQTRGGPPDPRSDLFSLGCVLYRACAGELPFKGADTLAILTALATETPRPVRDLNPEVPPPLAALVMRLLAKDPDRRPPSARAALSALAALEQGQAAERPVPPRPDANRQTSGPPATPNAPGSISTARLPAAELPAALHPASSSTEVAPAPQWRPGCVLGGIAAGVCCLAAGALFVTGVLLLAWSRQGPPAATVPEPKAEAPRPEPKAPPAEDRPPDPKAGFPVIRAAIKAHKYTRMPVLGGAFAKESFEEVPADGWILIGFEVGLEGFGNGSIVAYLRPIYLTPGGEKVGETYGVPTRQLVTMKARPGFAVGALNIRAGGLLDGFSVTFMEIGKTSLKKEGAYTSEHIGGMGGSDQGTVDGDGAFVIGICGRTVDKGRPCSLGLVLFRPEPK
jgi:serine/threonine protein kinase